MKAVLPPKCERNSIGRVVGCVPTGCGFESRRSPHLMWDTQQGVAAGCNPVVGNGMLGSIPRSLTIYCFVAQLAAQRIVTPKVPGSIPGEAAIYDSVTQLVECSVEARDAQVRILLESPSIGHRCFWRHARLLPCADKVRILGGRPSQCPSSPTGRGSGFKTRSVQVRILGGARIWRSVATVRVQPRICVWGAGWTAPTPTARRSKFNRKVA